MKTYLKFLSRNKLYTAIEFIGLSLALAFVIIAFCYVMQQYDKTQRQMRLVEIILAVAVLLALLGLVAMSTHFASEREKTIAIRKVFGGTMESETRRNLREYIIMMLIANVIAIPIAVWLCGHYLEGFAYRIPTYWWIFAIAAVLSFVIAIGSVLWQIISVAKVNPVSALKKE